MLSGSSKSQSQHQQPPDDPAVATPAPDAVPAANTWALWAPLSDAGEALFNLAANTLCPYAENSAAVADGPPPPTPTSTSPVQKGPVVAPDVAEPRPLRAVPVVDRTEPAHPAPTTPPPRPHSPAIPSGLTGVAATHPYSTAFLMGAAISGSVLAGAAAARVAMGRVGSQAAAAAASASGGGSRGLATASAPLRTLTKANGKGGPTAVAPAQVQALQAKSVEENDARLARLEMLVREMHMTQRGFLSTIVTAQPNISARLNDISAALAAQAEKSKSAGEALSKEMATHLDQVQTIQTLLREVHNRQKGFMDTIACVQPSIAARLGKIEEMLEADSDEARKLADKVVGDFSEAVRTLDSGIAARLNRIEDTLSAAVDKMGGAIDKVNGAVETANSAVEKVNGAVEQSQSAVSQAVSQDVFKSQTAVIMERLDKLDAGLAAISSHFATNPPEGGLGSVESSSINDLANEGIAADAESNPVDEPGTAKKSTQQKPRQKVSANSVKAKSAARGSKATEEDAPVSTTAAPSRSPSAPSPSEPSYRSHQPVEYLGVDDTGEWKFVLSGNPKGDFDAGGCVDLGVMLHRTSSRVSRKIPIWYEQTSTYTVGPFTTTVFYKDGDVDMILLDESWWGCSRAGDVYTITEHVQFAPPP